MKVKVKMKNRIAVFLSMVTCLTMASSCSFLGKGEGGSQSQDSSVEDSTQTLCGKMKGFLLSAGATQELVIGKVVGDKNYLTIQLATDTPLVGYIHYTDKTDSKKTHKEKYNKFIGKDRC